MRARVRRHVDAFASLSADEQALVRAAQLKRKEAKLARKQHAKNRKRQAGGGGADGGGRPDGGGGSGGAAAEGAPTRTTVTSDEYWDACPNGRFRDPNLPPTAEALLRRIRSTKRLLASRGLLGIDHERLLG